MRIPYKDLPLTFMVSPGKRFSPFLPSSENFKLRLQLSVYFPNVLTPLDH